MSVALSSSITSSSELAPEAGSADSARLASEILARARSRAIDEGLAYAGGVLPTEAWQLFHSGAAVLVDVRTSEERKFVGHVPDALHVAWATGTSMTRNPRFVRELEAKAKKDQVILLLCRSGKRSAAAAEAASKAGFSQVFNVLEGFEGELNAQNQRGDTGGWRHWSLPWVQD